MAREKNTARAGARRRTRAAMREARVAETENLTGEPEPANGATDSPAERTSLFRVPNVRDDIESLPDMFRTRRLMWLPFVVLLGSFVVALGMPYSQLDPGLAQLLFLYVQMAFLPQGLITFLLAGFIAPRASYLVGFVLGVFNAVLLLVFAGIRSEDVLSAGGDAGQAQIGLTLLVGYALVVGPLAAAFAAWYRGFLNRMGNQGRERRLAKEAELARKRKDERRAAKRPASS